MCSFLLTSADCLEFEAASSLLLCIFTSDLIWETWALSLRLVDEALLFLRFIGFRYSWQLPRSPDESVGHTISAVFDKRIKCSHAGLVLQGSQSHCCPSP